MLSTNSRFLAPLGMTSVPSRLIQSTSDQSLATAHWPLIPHLTDTDKAFQESVESQE